MKHFSTQHILVGNQCAWSGPYLHQQEHLSFQHAAISPDNLKYRKIYAPKKSTTKLMTCIVCFAFQMLWNQVNTMDAW